MINKAEIAYLEDDETLAFVTKDNLENHPFVVTHYTRGDRLMEDFPTRKFDLCILDIMLPGKDGFEVAAAIRRLNNDIPIIFLSAKTLKEDRIKGLQTGADDYLVKPFSIEELVLKIEVFLNRSRKNNPGIGSMMIGAFHFNPMNYELELDKRKIQLTQRESELLELLARQRNRVVKREEILKQIWGDNDYFMGRSLDVFISRLRKILSTDSNIVIENLHGIGFRFKTGT